MTDKEKILHPNFNKNTMPKMGIGFNLLYADDHVMPTRTTFNHADGSPDLRHTIIELNNPPEEPK